MTTLRRQRRSPSLILVCLALVGLPAALPTYLGQAATTEQIVTDPNTGIAIYGYDPVAYFTDRTTMRGRDDIEATHAGVVWRFRNAGNRAAFVEDPDVYMPRHGGYDPVAVNSNIARAGHPEVWAIHNDRLFLFHSDEARRQFEAGPDNVALQAEVNWPHVSRTLSP